jgi:hypothetical protein
MQFNGASTLFRIDLIVQCQLAFVKHHVGHGESAFLSFLFLQNICNLCEHVCLALWLFANSI